MQCVVSKMSDEESARKKARVEAAVEAESVNKCPYLNTVTRANLDFDMEKVCSMTLTKQNVYCCLVCGSFFQGRGAQTPCYTHSVQAGHFVFIHLQTAKTFCLPDGYEILDSSLNDVKRCLQPSFTSQEVASLDSNKTLSRDIHGAAYLPGFIGLNKVIPTDCINPVLHMLSHMRPVRDFFLQPQSYSGDKPLLLHFGELVRKLWSPGNFKSVLSPQELVHDIVTCSKKRLTLNASTDCIDLWNWLVGELHAGLLEGGAAGSGSGSPSTVISDCLTGEVEVNETKPDSSNSSSKRVSFKYLSLTVPPPPLFRDSEGALIIPQLPIFDLLKKFDGRTETEEVAVGGSGLSRKTYTIRKLPQFLLINLDRRGRNSKIVQAGDKNGTIVTFPAKNFELRNYLSPLDPSDGISASTKYDLVANICLGHSDSSSVDQVISIGTQIGPAATAATAAVNSSSGAGSGAGGGGGGGGGAEAGSKKFVVHLHNKATDQWFALDDLVVTEVLPAQIALSESHMLLYERRA